MKRKYDKLVRDKIPEIILKSGNECEVSYFSDEEYLEALKSKIVEEAQEISKASAEELLDELADLYEVVDCLLVKLNITDEMVREIQAKRREERGSFLKKIRLISTEIRR